MLDKYSKVLLKTVTAKNLTEEEGKVLLKEFNTCLRKASENRIEFLFLKTVKSMYSKIFDELGLDEIYRNGEVKIYDFNKAISLFQRELRGSNYAIIKTYYPFPAITSDIDILFFEKNEYEHFVKRMEKMGFFYENDQDLKGSLMKAGFMKCEPHLDISWYGMRFVSKNFIKENLIEKRVGQSNFFVPNSKATFLISAAHILFDCQYFSMRDYLVLREFVEDKELVADCIKEAERFGWGGASEYFVNTLFKIKQLEEKETIDEKLSLPFWIPIFYMLVFFKNKLIFDFREKKVNNFSVESVLLPFVYYFWKRLRSKYSRKIYRNSWLY